ncbi:extracellular catalytic domain type 1 short-chain-length polyhydroxyalkanoate depolymerase [Chromohalobacter israelensis]|uniref:extracellular catalytic domain type 1 short-chain-length polyhydroxyalkanoate depolymerase n=1 Tax=Chromohalobacter israelensis TaxID=141390 RepID=UPI000FFED6CC|nr:PHB depolymerase family esterase [Chromohalobacter salexigens]RXE49627.1 plasmid partitioning protein [Chromohalobacter salexigens]
MIDTTMTKRMEEATRLTRAGKLHDAMAVLQGATPGAPYRKDGAFEGNTFEGSCQVVDEEMTASRPASAGPIGSIGSESRRTDEPDAQAASFTAPGPASQAPPAGVPGGGLGVTAVWRDKWLKFRGAGVQPTHVRSTTEESLPGAFTAGRFTNSVGTRDYKLYIPSGHHGQALPLVVMLHGCTQDPDDFAAGTNMNRLAEEWRCCVLYPAQPMTANSSKCWNWFKAEDQQREGGEPAIIAGMTRQVIDTHGLDASRVYVAGLSAGGAMATTLAMTYPDLFAAVGVHSGLPHGVAQSLPDALGAMQGGTGPLGGRAAQASGWASEVPAIIFHGDRDTTVHPSNADRVAAQYATARKQAKTASEREDTARVTVEQGQVANGHAYTRTTHHDAKGEPRLEQWRIQGAGHAWSGGSTQGSYTDPKGPDATGEMLRFFYRHQGGRSAS